MKELSKFREPDHIFPAFLTAREQDVFAMLLCEISKHQALKTRNEKVGKETTIPHVFEFSEKTLMDAFKCSKDAIRKVLEPNAKSLQSRQVGFSDENGFDYFSPIGRVTYSMGNPFRIEMLPSVVDIIVKDGGFSELDFRLFARLNGRYEKRILREISKWKDSQSKVLRFSFAEFRKRLGVEDGKYTRIDAFKKTCIDEPIKAILTAADGLWEATDENGKGYEIEKTGRKQTHVKICLKFRVPKSKEKPLPSVYNTPEDAVNTYLKLKEDVEKPCIDELENLKNHIGLLIMDGYKIDDDFSVKFKAAMEACKK